MTDDKSPKALRGPGLFVIYHWSFVIDHFDPGRSFLCGPLRLRVFVIKVSRRRSTPTIVATPLPPLNFRKGLQQCPITAARPRAQRSHSGSPGAERKKIASP